MQIITLKCAKDVPSENGYTFNFFEPEGASNNAISDFQTDSSIVPDGLLLQNSYLG